MLQLRSSLSKTGMMDKMKTNITTLENETLQQNFTSIPQFYATLAGVELVSVPVITVFGIIGNAFSCVIFSTKPLNKYSSSFLLSCRSVSDIGFLTARLIIWASTVFDLHLSQIYPVCPIIVFLTYVFACLSVWLVTLVALENCIRLRATFCAKKIFNRRNAKAITACMTIAIVLCYSFPIWTIGQNCVPLENYHGLIKTMVHVDSALTMFAPSAIMILALVASAITFFKSRERLRKLSSSMTSDNPVRQATNMLFVVALTFVLLNLPSHVSRFRLMYLHAMIGAQISQSDSVFHAFAELIHYLSLAINFAIYYAFGRKFRVSFNEKVLRKRIRRQQYSAEETPGKRYRTQIEFRMCNNNNFTVTYYPAKDV